MCFQLLFKQMILLKNGRFNLIFGFTMSTMKSHMFTLKVYDTVLNYLVPWYTWLWQTLDKYLVMFHLVCFFDGNWCSFEKKKKLLWTSVHKKARWSAVWHHWRLYHISKFQPSHKKQAHASEPFFSPCCIRSTSLLGAIQFHELAWRVTALSSSRNPKH